jgi:hypothetical protein
MGVNGDKEPNNEFSKAEVIEDGTFTGNVTIWGGLDIDIYRIHLHRNEEINISAALLESGYLRIEGYFNEKDKIENVTFTIYDTGSHSFVKWKNDKGPRDIFIKITGNSIYKIQLKTSMGLIEGYLSDNLNSTLIFIGIVLIIAMVTTIVVLFFIRTIKLSITHGFEAKECDEGKKVGLVDKRFRHDCMEILTDENGVERMMKHEEAEIHRGKQDINQFKLNQLEDHYYIDMEKVQRLPGHAFNHDKIDEAVIDEE